MSEPPVAVLVQQAPCPFRIQIEERTLHFRKPARTSRGALVTRRIFRLHLRSPLGNGTGECCTMPGLSPEDTPEYVHLLHEACRETERQRGLLPGQYAHLPSIRLGLECALLRAFHPLFFQGTAFAQGQQGLLIHHLIWMDSPQGMLQQMEEGVRQGFHCLKFKIGALPFATECHMIEEARRRFPHCELRADANGSFSPEQAAGKLEHLARLGVNVVEQPLPPGMNAETAALAQDCPLTLALDEELIHATDREQKAQLLDSIHPHALVIKPSLHGGLSGAEEWASLAMERGICWWLNSALEGQDGLLALALWCARRAPKQMHGLGTGRLFLDDDPPKLRLQPPRLWHTTTNS